MNLTKFKDEVHKNAVEHGWWESNRSVEECLALVHSEWSEALEEDRAGRPMVWYACNECSEGKDSHLICNPNDEFDCATYPDVSTCSHRSKKPEGIAVELADGCIRILDYIGKLGFDIDLTGIDTLDKLMEATPEETYNNPIPTVIAGLHYYTSCAYVALTDDDKANENVKIAVKVLKNVPDDVIRDATRKAIERIQQAEAIGHLLEAVGVACSWIKANGLDPARVLSEKHEYNKTRPFKHGKAY